MKRSYRLSKKITEAQAAQILREMSELEGVKHVEMTEDLQHLHVEALTEDYPAIMGTAVNAFNREAGGTEITFEGFVY